jgi:hypothetical protein
VGTRGNLPLPPPPPLGGPGSISNFYFGHSLDELIEKRLSKSIARVNLFVTDLNDNPPKFLQDSYKHQLLDIYAYTVLQLNATDPDVGVNAEFDFGLHGVTRVSEGLSRR